MYASVCVCLLWSALLAFCKKSTIVYLFKRLRSIAYIDQPFDTFSCSSNKTHTYIHETCQMDCIGMHTQVVQYVQYVVVYNLLDSDGFLKHIPSHRHLDRERDYYYFSADRRRTPNKKCVRACFSTDTKKNFCECGFVYFSADKVLFLSHTSRISAGGTQKYCDYFEWN